MVCPEELLTHGRFKERYLLATAPAVLSYYPAPLLIMLPIFTPHMLLRVCEEIEVSSIESFTFWLGELRQKLEHAVLRSVDMPRFVSVRISSSTPSFALHGCVSNSSAYGTPLVGDWMTKVLESAHETSVASFTFIPVPTSLRPWRCDNDHWLCVSDRVLHMCSDEVILLYQVKIKDAQR